ncbi:putative prefoldin subunit 6 [Glarea lozoyensis 74030]|uniref:Putative prefoldin subunit 6 n=1 Tax=Glarea lozoyensis (strain ATCC 74030 / MF5533) TaxID=1104152 RepID=H0EJC9_GLAL7|nr:putative prefoldin subunit 6 [Glarea lozoyensis 74030]
MRVRDIEGIQHPDHRIAILGQPQNMAEVQQQLQALSAEYQAVQQDDAKIYKLVGPVLLKQEKTEAVLAVDGRLDYIVNEIKRVEKQIKDTEDKSDAVRSKIRSGTQVAKERISQANSWMQFKSTLL